MNIVILHAGTSGFFPRYYKAISDAIKQDGGQSLLLVPHSGRNKRNALPQQIMWGSRLNWFIHNAIYKFLGIQDIFSILGTIDLIRKLNRINPDVIHFNIINDKIINLPILIRYINKKNIPIVWTQHDCRSFTGQCTYFDKINCKQWVSGCGNCPICETFIDNTHLTWLIRKKYYTKIKKMIVVTPSQWLYNFVKESLFKEYPIRVIYNGVDTDNFSHKTDLDIRKLYNIPKTKKVILGCAIAWEPRKGLVYFEKLSSMLPENYQIVLVGNINAEYKLSLKNKGIICTGKTKSFSEMRALYQTASVFCNPTMADNFPTVNIEALAAGTPIVTFKTGGSPEAIDENTGIIVEQGNINALLDAIIAVVENRDKYNSKNCILRSKLFSNEQYKLYVKLFHEISEK